MGVDGCFGVQGARGGHKNKAIRGHLGPSMSVMTGEISPDMMFLVFCQKWSKMGVEGCGWMHMGAIGDMLTGGNTNKTKKIYKCSVRTCFDMHRQCQK